LRELRWALDFADKGHLKVVPLSLHPAVTFGEREKLVRQGDTQGLVFSSKEKKVKRMCPEAIALMKRLNDVHMSMLPWDLLQAWLSDEEKSDWEESVACNQSGLWGGVSRAPVALCGNGEAGVVGLVESVVDAIRNSLVCTNPRPASECVALDDTQALLASDVDRCSLAIGVLDASKYPEESAQALRIELEEANSQKRLAKRRREEDRVKAAEDAKQQKCATLRSFLCTNVCV
jgi:hypothetical protein